jgi:hypothetical protein
VTADAVPAAESPVAAETRMPAATPAPSVESVAISPAPAPETTGATSAAAPAEAKADDSAAREAPTAPAPASAASTPPAAATVRETNEAEILLIREALQAWEAGDLATGRRALLQLARLLQHGTAVPAQRDEMEPRTLAFQHEGFGPVP